VWDETRGAHYTIWLVAFILYVYDSAKLLSPRELLLVEAGHGRLAPGFSDNPFTLAGRVLLFAPLLQPFRSVFVAPWGKPWARHEALKTTLASIEDLRSALRSVRILATGAFLLLFVVGPVSTWLLGPDAAVLYTAAVVYPTTLAAVGCMWWQRRALRLTASRLTVLSAEIVVCPAFLPNLVRKITTLQPVEIDGAQIIAAAADPTVRDELFTRLEARIEDLPDDDLEAYRSTIREAGVSSARH
jgi:hypothetical protein